MPSTRPAGTRSTRTRPARTLVAATAALAVAAGLAACGGTSAPSGETTSSVSTGAGGTLTVFAAASLTQTFTEIGKDFEAAHPGTTVRFSFAGSSSLVTQLQQGAPADVFASADTANMDKVTSANLVSGSPVDFATNTLEIAVPPSNPAKISSFADLTRSGVKVVVCAPQVPCGSATEKIEQATGTTLSPVSEESSVTDVLGKVTSGEADAGLVYVTDVTGAGDKVKGVPFSESSKAVNTYPIATLTASKDPTLAREFVSYVTGSEGQQVLADAGFAKP